MGDVIGSGNVKIKHGIHSFDFPGLAGRKCGEIMIRLREVYSIKEGSQIRVNGRVVDEDCALKDGDVLEFIRPQGEKAMEKITQFNNTIRIVVTNNGGEVVYTAAFDGRKKPTYKDVCNYLRAATCVPQVVKNILAYSHSWNGCAYGSFNKDQTATAAMYVIEAAPAKLPVPLEEYTTSKVKQYHKVKTLVVSANNKPFGCYVFDSRTLSVDHGLTERLWNHVRPTLKDRLSPNTYVNVAHTTTGGVVVLTELPPTQPVQVPVQAPIRGQSIPPKQVVKQQADIPPMQSSGIDACAYLDIKLGDIKEDIKKIREEVSGGQKAVGRGSPILVTHNSSGFDVGDDDNVDQQKEERKNPMQVTVDFSPRKLAFSALVMGLVSCMTFAGARYYHDARFDANFSKYVKAAQAAQEKGDVERAKKYEARAMEWLEANDMVSGNTSVFLDGGPEADIAEWHKDVQKAWQVKSELPAPPKGVLQGIEIYPYNKQFCLWLLSSAAMAIFGATGLIFGRKRS